MILSYKNYDLEFIRKSQVHFIKVYKDGEFLFNVDTLSEFEEKTGENPILYVENLQNLLDN